MRPWISHRQTSPSSLSAANAIVCLLITTRKRPGVDGCLLFVRRKISGRRGRGGETFSGANSRLHALIDGDDPLCLFENVQEFRARHDDDAGVVADDQITLRHSYPAHRYRFAQRLKLQSALAGGGHDPSTCEPQLRCANLVDVAATAVDYHAASVPLARRQRGQTAEG